MKDESQKPPPITASHALHRITDLYSRAYLAPPQLCSEGPTKIARYQDDVCGYIPDTWYLVSGAGARVLIAPISVSELKSSLFSADYFPAQEFFVIVNCVVAWHLVHRIQQYVYTGSLFFRIFYLRGAAVIPYLYQ